MRTAYSKLGRVMRRIGRSLRPIPGSPAYTDQDDICGVKLVPERPFTDAVRRALRATRANDAPGAYLEFGVFNGTSLACAARSAAAEGNSDLRLIGIDSFEGLPAKVVDEDGGAWTAGQFACSLDDARRCLARSGVNPDKMTLIRRWYDELEPSELAAALQGAQVRIVMMDCDAYSSARRALSIVTDFLAPTSVIFFDDWRLRDVDLIDGGEYRAFNEWQADNPGIRVERFQGYSRKSEAYRLQRT